MILLGAFDFGSGRIDSRLCLSDDGLLQMASGGQIGDSGLLRSYRGNGTGARGDIVTVIQLHEDVAGMDRLIVGDSHAGNKATHFRCDYGDVTTNVSVVGALHESANSPPVVTECCQRRDDDQCRTRDDEYLPGGKAARSSGDVIRTCSAGHTGGGRCNLSICHYAIHIELRACARQPFRRQVQDADAFVRQPQAQG